MTRVAAALLMIGVLSDADSGQRSDPWVGVWVLDTAQSTPLNANVKSQRLVLEVVAGALKDTAINIDHKDEERAREVTLPLDGSEVTLGAGNATRFDGVDVSTFERVAKDTAGRVVSILRTQVSRDGRVTDADDAAAREGSDDARAAGRGHEGLHPPQLGLR